MPTPLVWESIATMNRHRVGHCVVSLNGLVYAIGGADPVLFGLLSSVEVYNPATNQWTYCASMPGGGRSYMAAAAVNGKIYVIGGATSGSGAVLTDRVEEYNPQTNIWITKAVAPTSRWQMGAAVVNNKIYVMGGRVLGGPGGTTTSVNEVYNPTTNGWITKSPMPVGRFGISMGAIGTKIYVAGGSVISGYIDDSHLNDEYDATLDTWVVKNNIPIGQPATYCGYAVLNNVFYMMGGKGLSGQPKQVEAYNHALDIWTPQSPAVGSIPDMITRRDSCFATTNNNRIYVCGGDTFNASDSNKCEAYGVNAGPITPQNVFAIQRRNYTILSWDAVALDTDGSLLQPTGYNVYRSLYANESERTLVAQVTSTDVAGNVDTIFVDAEDTNPKVYRVSAVVSVVGNVLESELSESATAIKTSSQIDGKTELIDRKLGVWDEGLWDEGLWS